MPETTRKRIRIKGTVKGTGFGLFVYRLAESLRIAGFLKDERDEVLIEAEGINLNKFLKKLQEAPPPALVIERISDEIIPTLGETIFRITGSEMPHKKRLLISPDVAACENCLKELFTVSNRRYHYPFISCAECGAKFSSLIVMPSYRKHTIWSGYKMCKRCRAEFKDPLNRRFHQQNISCPECGPSMWLVSAEKARICWEKPEKVFSTSIVMAQAKKHLDNGAVLAVKGRNGFFLLCDGDNKEAMEKLYGFKRAGEKQVIVIISDASSIKDNFYVSPEDLKLLLANERPALYYGLKNNKEGFSRYFNSNGGELPVMLPRTPLEFILAEDGRRLLMIPEVTENLPVIGREKDAIAEYVEVADYFLLHDLPINVRMNLTMGYPHQGQAQYIRLGRGIIPLTIELEREFPHKTVAVGSDSNNAFCLAFGKEVVISHHIGWLKNYSAFQAFEEAIFHFYRLYRFTPELLVCDLHPDYISSSWAERQRIPQKRVQHHHAHIASCLAENGHFSRVLGIALDGGGYGVDGALWGGEFLVGGIPYGFKREGHIQYFPLPGGDAAIKEPWRIMIGLLWEIFRDHWRDNAPSEFLNLLPPDEVMVVEDMLKSGFNCRPTSACGRLFDAVASMVFAKNKFDYPSQGAIDFEGLLKKELREKDPELWEQSPYRYEIRRESPSILELSGLILGLLEDLRKGVSREEISFRFHLSMVTALKEMVIKIARRENIETIALSGGVFLNLHLLTWLKRLLEQDEFRVLTPQKLPTGDGGICLGQAVLANF